MGALTDACRRKRLGVCSCMHAKKARRKRTDIRASTISESTRISTTSCTSSDVNWTDGRLPGRGGAASLGAASPLAAGASSVAAGGPLLCTFGGSVGGARCAGFWGAASTVGAASSGGAGGESAAGRVNWNAGLASVLSRQPDGSSSSGRPYAGAPNPKADACEASPKTAGAYCLGGSVAGSKA